MAQNETLEQLLRQLDLADGLLRDQHGHYQAALAQLQVKHDAYQMQLARVQSLARKVITRTQREG